MKHVELDESGIVVGVYANPQFDPGGTLRTRQVKADDASIAAYRSEQKARWDARELQAVDLRAIRK